MISFLPTLAFLNNPIEWIVLGLLGLLIFGKRLPEVGRSIGRGIVEFKKGLSGIDEDVNRAGQSNPQQAQGTPGTQMQPPQNNPYAQPHQQPQNPYAQAPMQQPQQPQQQLGYQQPPQQQGYAPQPSQHAGHPQQHATNSPQNPGSNHPA